MQLTHKEYIYTMRSDTPKLALQNALKFAYKVFGESSNHRDSYTIHIYKGNKLVFKDECKEDIEKFQRPVDKRLVDSYGFSHLSPIDWQAMRDHILTLLKGAKSYKIKISAMDTSTNTRSVVTSTVQVYILAAASKELHNTIRAFAIELDERRKKRGGNNKEKEKEE